MLGDIGAVVFDLGGVVCRWLPERRLKLLANVSHLPEDTVVERLWDSGFVEAADSGRHTKQTEFEYFRQALDICCTYQTFRSVWCSAFVPDTEVLTIVDLVRSRVATVLLSDNGPVALEGISHELSRVRCSFDHVFMSWQFGVTKPDGQIFTQVQQAIGLDPHRILFIDDTLRNVEGARKEGWKSELYDSPKQLLFVLQKHGVLP